MGLCDTAVTAIIRLRVRCRVRVRVRVVRAIRVRCGGFLAAAPGSLQYIQFPVTVCLAVWCLQQLLLLLLLTLQLRLAALPRVVRVIGLVLGLLGLGFLLGLAKLGFRLRVHATVRSSFHRTVSIFTSYSLGSVQK